jgi:hypothetical protein
LITIGGCHNIQICKCESNVYYFNVTVSVYEEILMHAASLGVSAAWEDVLQAGALPVRVGAG